MNDFSLSLGSKRVAAYCRVSTDKNDQVNSLANQQHYFERFIAQNPDWELYEVFADEGTSGTSTKKRAAFNRMIHCAEKQEFDFILTKEISRFARNTLDSIYYTRYLKTLGIGVLFLNDNINTLDADAELRLTIMSSIAQEESRKTSERVKWGQKRRMEQGVVFGRSMLGYNVHDGKITINKSGAQIVRLIFHKYIKEGKGAHTIAKELQSAGFSPMHACCWSPSVILRILKNEKYCGDLVQKKTYTPDYLSHQKKYNHGVEEYVILKDHHEPIISHETFDLANEILHTRSLSQKHLAKSSHRYPLSGKIKCGKCGSNYVARRKRRKDGTYSITWRCLKSVQLGKQHGCAGVSLSNDEILALLRTAIHELPFDKEALLHNTMHWLDTFLFSDLSEKKVHKTLAAIDAVHKKQNRLLDLYIEQTINQAEFERSNNRYRLEENQLQSVLSSITQEHPQPVDYTAVTKQIFQEMQLLLNGESSTTDFYTSLLHELNVSAKKGIRIQFKFLPFTFTFI